MSDETTSTPDDILDDLALRHALGSLDDAERAHFETCMSSPDSRAGKLAAEYIDLVATVSLAALPASESPPPEVKERVMAAIRTRSAGKTDTRSAPPHITALLMAGDDLPWMPTPYRGVRVRELSTTSPDYSIIMLSCDPGAVFPPHDHAGSEDAYIMSGEAIMHGRVLRTGDFMHAEPGSHHHDLISATGCQVLIITSRKNYSPRAARVYSIAHRVASRIGRALGVGAGG